MQLYRCKVRLKGSLLHEMPKIGVSAPEILILREIHQGDNAPVVEITPMGSNKKPGVNAAERDRPNSTYGPKIDERQFPTYGELPALLPTHADIQRHLAGTKRAAPTACPGARRGEG